MPKLAADESHLDSLVHWIGRHPELAHLRAKRRGDTLTILSGPEDDVIPHARLRRSSIQWWTLEIATHTGRWESTPIRAGILPALDALVHDFPWTLTPRE